MDLTNYTKRKKLGFVTINKVDKKQSIITSKRFDPNTGEEAEAAVLTVHLEQLQEKKKTLLAQLKQVEALEKDILEQE